MFPFTKLSLTSLPNELIQIITFYLQENVFDGKVGISPSNIAQMQLWITGMNQSQDIRNLAYTCKNLYTRLLKDNNVIYDYIYFQLCPQDVLLPFSTVNSFNSNNNDSIQTQAKWNISNHNFSRAIFKNINQIFIGPQTPTSAIINIYNVIKKHRGIFEFQVSLVRTHKWEIDLIPINFYALVDHFILSRGVNIIGNNTSNLQGAFKNLIYLYITQDSIYSSTKAFTIFDSIYHDIMFDRSHQLVSFSSENNYLTSKLFAFTKLRSFQGTIDQFLVQSLPLNLNHLHLVINENLSKQDFIPRISTLYTFTITIKSVKIEPKNVILKLVNDICDLFRYPFIQVCVFNTRKHIAGVIDVLKAEPRIQYLQVTFVNHPDYQPLTMDRILLQLSFIKKAEELQKKESVQHFQNFVKLNCLKIFVPGTTNVLASTIYALAHSCILTTLEIIAKNLNIIPNISTLSDFCYSEYGLKIDLVRDGNINISSLFRISPNITNFSNKINLDINLTRICPLFKKDFVMPMNSSVCSIVDPLETNLSETQKLGMKIMCCKLFEKTVLSNTRNYNIDLNVLRTIVFKI